MGEDGERRVNRPAMAHSPSAARRGGATVRSEGLVPIARVSGEEISVAPERPVRVTVVIPNYNYGRYLPQSVGSSLAQKGVDVDIVVVDDRSTDDSAEVLAALAAADSRVRVVMSSDNRGAVETFNAGLDLAEGDYVVRLDADDILTPGSIARAVALGERFPSVGLIYGRPVLFQGDPPTRLREVPSGWTVWSGEEWLDLRCRVGVNCITSPEVVMRATTIRAAGGGQLVELRHAHDMEMWYRLARFGDVAHVDGADQALHREHDGSFSAREVDVIGDMRHREQVFECLFRDGSARSRELHDLARRALANEALTRAAQACAAGRGDSDEVEAYLRFAAAQGVPIDDLPAGHAVRWAQRIGPRRARLSPYLLARAARVRATSRRRAEEILEFGI